MAYIDVLKQPKVNQVDSLIGISNNEIKQITPDSLNEQLIITTETESIPEKWYTELINRVENDGPMPNILFKDDYEQYYSIFNISQPDDYIEVRFSSTYCYDPETAETSEFSDMYVSSTRVTINEPVDGSCSVSVYSAEIDLQTGINNTVSDLPIPIILVPGEYYDKVKVFNVWNNYTYGLKTNNIFLSVNNSLIPLSGFTASSATYARLFFVSVPITDGQAGRTEVYSLVCTDSSSLITPNVLNTAWILPLCGYRSYFVDISDLAAGDSQSISKIPVYAATNCLTDGDKVWTKVHHITQEQLDAVTAKFQEKFPNANLSSFHWVFESNGLTTPIGDSINNWTIAVFGSKIYRLS